jgi:hypothetical protein
MAAEPTRRSAMLGELGRRADAALTRGADAVHEGVHATVLHARRIAGAVTVAVTRVRRETQDLAWDYKDVAAGLRRPEDGAPGRDEVDASPDEGRPALRVVGSDE